MISKLTEEKTSALQQNQKLHQELVMDLLNCWLAMSSIINVKWSMGICRVIVESKRIVTNVVPFDSYKKLHSYIVLYLI